MDAHQHGPQDEFGADGAVVLVGTAGLRIGPGKPTADGRVVRLRVDGADILAEKDAAATLHPGAPLTPPRAVDHRRAVGRSDGSSLVLTQSDAVSAARGLVGTGVARQRREFAHART